MFATLYITAVVYSHYVKIFKEGNMKKIMSFFLLVSIGILGISNTSLANENDSFKKEI